MKNRTNEYLGILAILKSTLQRLLIIISTGIILVILGLMGVGLDLYDSYLSLVIGVILIGVGLNKTETLNKKIEKLKQQYNNEKDFSGIIAEL
jgi:hypothetical protein